MVNQSENVIPNIFLLIPLKKTWSVSLYILGNNCLSFDEIFYVYVELWFRTSDTMTGHPPWYCSVSCVTRTRIRSWTTTNRRATKPQPPTTQLPPRATSLRPSTCPSTVSVHQIYEQVVHRGSLVCLIGLI